jgi:hypothetical protein
MDHFLTIIPFSHNFTAFNIKSKKIQINIYIAIHYIDYINKKNTLKRFKKLGFYSRKGIDKILSIPFLLFMDSAKAGIPSSAVYKKYRRPQSLNSSCVLYSLRSQFPPLTMATYPKEHPCSRARTCTLLYFSSASTNIIRNISTPKASPFVKTTSLGISKYRI